MYKVKSPKPSEYNDAEVSPSIGSRSLFLKPNAESVLLALFYVAYIVKALPLISSFPFDFTVVIAGLLLVLAFFALVKRGLEAQILLILGGLFLVFGVAAFFGHHLDSLVTNKGLQFFTLNSVAVFAPVVLIRSHTDLRRFVSALVGILTLIAVVSFFSFLELNDSTRLTSYEGNTTGLSRILCLLALFLVVAVILGKMNFLLSSPVLVIVGIMVLSVGSRGPFLSLAISVSIVIIMFYFSRVRGKLLRNLLGILIVLVAIDANSDYLPFTSTRRLLQVYEVLEGNIASDNSTQARAEAFRYASDTILDTPVGSGLSSYSYLYDNAGRYSQLAHPHNIFLEIFFEGGWLSGVYYILVFGYALVLCGQIFKQNPNDINMLFLVASTIFLFISAQVSGDLLSNRHLMGNVGLIISVGIRSKHADF